MDHFHLYVLFFGLLIVTTFTVTFYWLYIVLSNLYQDLQHHLRGSRRIR